MNDPVVALAVATFLEADPTLAGVAIYAHFDRVVEGVVEPQKPGEEIVLPAILIDSKSEPLAGSPTIARSTLQIVVESQLDDAPASEHNARATAARDRMANTPELLTAFNLRGLKLLGRPAATQSDPEVEQHAVRAVFTYVLGYREA